MPLRLLVEPSSDRDGPVVGLPAGVLKILGADLGDYILLRGSKGRQTIGVAAESETSEWRIQIGAITRKNLDVHAGEEVTVCRLEGVVAGETISVRPFADTLIGIAAPGALDLTEAFLAPFFSKHGLGRPVVVGDSFEVPSGGASSVEFRVVDVHPGPCCSVGLFTAIHCEAAPIQRGEPLPPSMFSPLLAVEVKDLKSIVLLPREDILRTTKVAWIKARMKRVAHHALVRGIDLSASQAYIAKGCGIKLLHHRRSLVDEDTLEDSCFGVRVELTAVLFVRTYEVISWGEQMCGGLLRHDEALTAPLLKKGVTRLFGNGRAFAAQREGGQIVSWGDPACGGDSRHVEHLLNSNIINVVCNSFAFAALREGGLVVAWGDTECGGDLSSSKRDLSSGVSKLFATDGAFAALKEDGSIVTWGSPAHGGDSANSPIAAELTGDIIDVYPNNAAFAAVKQTGRVVAWGDPDSGGDPSATEFVEDELSCGVASVKGNGLAYAALKENGAVIVWGNARYGGAPPEAVKKRLAAGGVVMLQCNQKAFAAITGGGAVVTWGEGADNLTQDVVNHLSCGVASITCNNWAFAALKGSIPQRKRWDTESAPGSSSASSVVDDSAGPILKRSTSIVTWGDPAHGGSPDAAAAEKLRAGGFKEVVCNDWAFAALRDDGSVVTWGQADSGGDPGEEAAAQLAGGVVSIIGKGRSFVAVKEGGAVVAWGESTTGGCLGDAREQLREGVIAVHANDGAYAALKRNGAVVTWGSRLCGGAASTVASRGAFEGSTLRSVASQLETGVKIIHSNGSAFVALKEASVYVV